MSNRLRLGANHLLLAVGLVAALLGSATVGSYLYTSVLVAQTASTGGTTTTTSSTFFCNSLGRQATKAECDTADAAKYASTNVGTSSGACVAPNVSISCPADTYHTVAWTMCAPVGSNCPVAHSGSTSSTSIGTGAAAGSMPTCASGQVPTAAVPCQLPAGATGTSSDTIYCPATKTQTTAAACEAATPVCPAGVNPSVDKPCKPAAGVTTGVQPTVGTQTQPQPGQQPAYTQMQPCAAGQTPTVEKPCLPSGQQSQYGQQGQQGLTSTSTATFWCYSLNKMANRADCDAADKARSTASSGFGGPGFPGGFGGFDGGFGAPGGFGSGFGGSGFGGSFGTFPGGGATGGTFPGQGYGVGGQPGSGTQQQYTPPSLPTFYSREAAGGKNYCESEAGKNDFFCKAGKGMQSSAEFEKFDSSKFANNYKDQFKGQEENQVRFVKEEASRVKRDVQRNRQEYERFVKRSGGATCPVFATMEKALQQAEEIAAAMEGVTTANVAEVQAKKELLHGGPNVDPDKAILPSFGRLMPQAGQCEMLSQMAKELQRLQSKVVALKVGEGKKSDLEKLKADIEVAIKDPAKFFGLDKEQSFGRPFGGLSEGPGEKMRDLWERYGELEREGNRFGSSDNACEEIKHMQEEISRFKESGSKDVPAEMVDKALSIIKDALSDKSPEACPKAMFKLHEMERQAFGEKGGPGREKKIEFVKEDDLIKRNLGYDRKNIAEAVKGGLDEKAIEKLIADKLAAIQEKVLKQIDEKVRQVADLYNVKLTILTDKLMTQFADQAATLATSLKTVLGNVGERVGAKVSEKLTNIATYLPKEKADAVIADKIKVVEPVQNVVASLPADVAKAVPGIDKALEVVTVHNLSEKAVVEIKQKTDLLANQLKYDVKADASGKPVVDEAKKDEVVKAVKAWADEVKAKSEDKKELELQVKEGKLAHIDVKPDAWYADTALGAKAKGIIRGQEKDGTTVLAADSILNKAEAMVMTGRLTGVDERPNAAPKNVPEWARGQIGGLIEKGVLDKKEVEKTNFAAPMGRLDVADLAVKAVKAADLKAFTELEKNIGKCDLKFEDVKCDNAKANAVNILQKVGVVSGQGDGSTFGIGNLNRGEASKFMMNYSQFHDKLTKEGAASLNIQVGATANVSQ